jgi:hypothetical protein
MGQFILNGTLDALQIFLGFGSLDLRKSREHDHAHDAIVQHDGKRQNA